MDENKLNVTGPAYSRNFHPRKENWTRLPSLMAAASIIIKLQ